MSDSNINNTASVRRFRFPLRLLTGIMAFVLLAVSLPVFASDTQNTSVHPENGSVFRFRNVKTGLYLSVYASNKKKTPCKTYLAASDSSDSSQFFRLSLNEDSSWTIVPKSESEAYCIAFAAGAPEGSDISLVKKNAETDLSGFDITRVSGDTFTVAPSSGDNYSAVLSATGELSSAKHSLVKIGNYVYGDDAQKWVLEPVLTEKITSSFTHTTLKTYTSGKMYARKYPDDSAENNIVWTSDNEDVLLISENGDYCTLSAGTAHLTASADGCSLTVTVEVSDSDCFTWYSQNSITVSDWDGTLLSDLKFRAEGRNKVFAADIDSGKSNWISSGCALCSLSMVLHNLGATLKNGYDLRSGQDGNLPADPYTVALANAGSKGVRNSTDQISGSPIYMRWNAVADRFTVDGKTLKYKKYYSPTKKSVISLLEKHPAGVIVVYQRGVSETHYLVVSGLVNPKETVSSKMQFTVFDPSGYVPEKGDGVPFSSTYTATRFGYIYAAYAFDTSDRF